MHALSRAASLALINAQLREARGLDQAREINGFTAQKVEREQYASNQAGRGSGAPAKNAFQG